MRVWVVLGLGLSLLLGGLAAQDFEQGVEAYKNARYAEATEAFRRAVTADPDNINARLYLATALMSQYIPGADDPANQAFAREAETEFEGVLARNPGNKTALASLASLAYQEAQGSSDPNAKLAKLDLAAERYQKLASVDPQNKEAYYSLGVIDWQRWFPAFQTARASLSMRPEDPGPLTDYNVRQDLLLRFGPVIEEGMQNLQKALDIDPKYDDAMAYMNLLIRERADLSDTSAEYQAEVAVADEWVQKALDTKREKAAAAAATHPDTIVALGGVPQPNIARGNAQSNIASATPQRIRLGGNVQAKGLLTKVIPVYPPEAKAARIQGTVRFTAIISPKGRVVHLQLVSGDSSLAEAARDAVMQWTYKPTLLNGEPVEVVTQIDVNFTLSQ